MGTNNTQYLSWKYLVSFVWNQTEADDEASFLKFKEYRLPFLL